MLAARLTDFLTEHIPQYDTQKYVLAVSGGMDSMLLLHLFKKLNLNLAVAHCNFNLRGEESNGDEEFVKQQCILLNVPFYAKHFDTLKEKEEQKEGTQVVARKLRYEWFEELRRELSYDYICTAHHQRDNVETLIQRFMQGAYPESMQGIRPIHGTIVRPLLKMKYEELHSYAIDNKIAYRTDSSNATDNYTRNKIRHKVLPVLREVFGDDYEHKIESITKHYNAYYEAIKILTVSLMWQKNHWYEINSSTLSHLPGNNALLYEMLKNYGFNWAQCENICSDLNREQGAVFESNDRRFNLFFASDVLQLVSVSNTNFYIELILDDTSPKEISFPYAKLSLRIINRKELQEFQPGTLYIDYNSVMNKKITLRSWEAGDVFTPMGMTGKKSVADFLKDLKQSPAEKQYQKVLCVDEHIACVLGKRIDDAYKITEATELILVLEETNE